MKIDDRIYILGVVLLMVLSSFTSVVSLVEGKENASSANTADVGGIMFKDDFKDLQVDKVDLGGNGEQDSVSYDRITVPGCSSFGDAGKPVLPVKGKQVLIPYNKVIDSIEVITGEKTVLSGAYNVEPATEPIPLDQDFDNYSYNVTINETVYNSDKPYPGKFYDVVSVQMFRGYKILILRLYPVQYIPKSGEVYYYKNLAVKVNTKPISSQLGATSTDDIYQSNFRGLQEDMGMIQTMVVNPEDANSYSNPLSLSAMSGDSSIYKYVIITNEKLKDADGEYTFQDLLDAKSQMGLDGKIVTVEEISKVYDGSDVQEKIRNFIRFAYNNWGTEYVLLGGDDDIIPARKLFVRTDNSERAYKALIESDIYYACLDGNFNGDGDQFFGEPNDGPDGGDVDLMAEVYVGRASVDTAKEVSNFVKKTIRYMESDWNTDGYLHNALWLGEYLFPNTWGKDYKEEMIDGSDNHGYTTVGVPSDRFNIDRLYDKDRQGEGKNFWNKSEIIDKLNDDVHLINHLGHANNFLALKMTVKDIISRLTNDKYFILYSQGCLAGAFSPPGHDCFAEYMTVNSSHGAVAAIMNAHYGWGVRGDTDGPSQRFDREFWDALFSGSELKVTLGKANQDSKEDNLYRIDEQCMRWCYYEINLFGDPALRVKGVPSGLSFSQKSFDFGKMYPGETNSKQFEIWSNDDCFSFSIAYHLTTDCDWLAVSPAQGSCGHDHEVHSIRVDTTGMDNGSYVGNVIVHLDDFGIEYILTVEVKVGSILAFSPEKSVFLKMDEGETYSKHFDIWNDGVGTLIYSLSESCPWLEVSPSKGRSSGENDRITLKVDTTGLSNGWHTYDIVISSNGGKSVLPVKVGVGPILAISEDSYDFGDVNIFGEDVSATFRISNCGIKTLSYSLSSDCDWLSVIPSSGSLSEDESDTIKIIVKSGNLLDACGFYKSTIDIDSNGGKDSFDAKLFAIANINSSRQNNSFKCYWTNNMQIARDTNWEVYLQPEGSHGKLPPLNGSSEIYKYARSGDHVHLYDYKHPAPVITMTRGTGSYTLVSAIPQPTMVGQGWLYMYRLPIQGSGGKVKVPDSDDSDGPHKDRDEPPAKPGDSDDKLDPTVTPYLVRLFLPNLLSTGDLGFLQRDDRKRPRPPDNPDDGGAYAVPATAISDVDLIMAYAINRAHISFSGTSLIPDNALIKDARLSLAAMAGAGSGDPFSLVIQDQHGGSVNFPIAEQTDQGLLLNWHGGYNNIPLSQPSNTAGKTSQILINKIGATDLSLRTDRDIEGLSPVFHLPTRHDPREGDRTSSSIDSFIDPYGEWQGSNNIILKFYEDTNDTSGNSALKSSNCWGCPLAIFGFRDTLEEFPWYEYDFLYLAMNMIGYCPAQNPDYCFGGPMRPGHLPESLLNNTPYLTVEYGLPPGQPSDMSASSMSSDRSVKLNVNVFDPDGNSMNVYFYDASNNNLIGIAKDVNSGETATITWKNLQPGKTYDWYSVATDGIFRNTSATSSFTTTSTTKYTLSVSVDPSGSGSVLLDPAGGTYEDGTIVTVTAAANTGYKFDHWSGDISGSDLSKEVTMDSDKTVVAHFSKVIGGYTLDTSVNPTGSGSITLSPSGGIYEDGTVVTITATPNSGFVFNHWEGDLSGSSSSVQITMDSNKTVTAVFNDSNTPSLSVSINKPESSSLYIRDRKLPMELKRLVTPIVIGKMTIDVEVENAVGDVTVEFYVDDVLKMNVTSGDSSFSWTWDERAFFRHTIKVVACDQGDNSGEASIEVFIFHL